MKKRLLVCGYAVLSLVVCNIATAEPTAPEEVRGMRCISNAPFPAPAGAVSIPVPGGDFETNGKIPPGWYAGGCTIVDDADAPQGKAYCTVKATKGNALRSPLIPADPGKPYFLSFWLKNPSDNLATLTFGSDERLETLTGEEPGIPSTGNQWKRVGIYFWMPIPGKTIQFHINPRDGRPEDQIICVDDIQLRTATEAEFSAAYETERSHLPPYEALHRPDDGKNLALSIAKWEGRAGIPGKPFVIWALGASWTDCQQNGNGLLYEIRKRYPHAPPLIYKKHAGGGTPWDYVRGWARQFIPAEQPDLVFIYTVGSTEALDDLLAQIRLHTTADIILPSMHFVKGQPLDPEGGWVSWQTVREICKKHGAEFVEHRRDMVDYLKNNKLEITDLLADAGHQNQHGRTRIWDSVARHLNTPADYNYTPESRERRIAVVPPAKTATEQVTLSSEWKTANGAVHVNKAGASLKVHFTGNRIDVLGRKTPGGGTARVLVDGGAADQAPVFYTSFIQAKPKVWPQVLGGQQGDHAPHAVTLGKNVVPQKWTITSTSDVGDYRIEGSVTGPDGEGNVAQPFVSKSGQIAIDPKLWRNGRVEKDGKTLYGTMTGDTFTFDVFRCATGRIDFQAGKPAPFSEPLVQNLPNGEHTLEIVAAGDGEVSIDGLYVFQPPEKE